MYSYLSLFLHNTYNILYSLLRSLTNISWWSNCYSRNLFQSSSVCVCVCVQLILHLAIHPRLMDVNFISPSFVSTDNATQNDAVRVFSLFVEVNLPAIFIEMRMLRQGVNRVTSFLDITLHRGFTIHQSAWFSTPCSTEYVFKVFNCCQSDMWEMILSSKSFLTI